ncbi:aldo/keto reductase [Lentibacillus cibarius]|uniref:Aldo/keto reductase n=1 Tax=Lentibacillus cibarius TaxID=2583219 RepID=A0A549YL87_9BACI|nr:aldo/keto reductase [Lentibacillus cibarius]TMN20739.1 aldo/keto reductase [Lentibacillus cibarius]TRM12634.1 aldo/keto reductase [Lentibacillus cibarius]
MKKNQLGQSDLYVSELTLGCMSLGTDSNQAKAIIDRALDAGINHLDTADLYSFGRNEEIVGSAIKDKRDQIILTTKVGNHFDRDQQDWFWDPSKEHIEQGIKDSLHRLGTDYIDFYMLHGGTIDDPIDETIEAFESLKSEGLIRAYGISSIRPNVIREYVQRSHMDAVMMQYNMLDRRPEEEILDLLHDNQISVLTRGPLAKGMLSNRANEQIAKKGKDGFLDYSHAELKTIQQKLEQLAGDESLNALALTYVLKHPAVASAVFGASSMEQVTENTQFDPAVLSDEIYREIQEMTKPVKYTNHR